MKIDFKSILDAEASNSKEILKFEIKFWNLEPQNSKNYLFGPACDL